MNPMPDIASLIQSGSTNLLLFIPTAILLGALHGLEPGHSKTMMAAFIIAVRGTVWQAVLLGLAATVSHTAIVWAIAIAGLHFGTAWSTETTEPYLQLVSAVLILGVALWMLWRTWSDQQAAHHHHHQEAREIDIGHGTRLALDIFERDVPPRWRLEQLAGAKLSAGDLTLETQRPDGSRKTFSFTERDGLYESNEEIPEPHEFTVKLSVGHHGCTESATLNFHVHDHLGGLNVAVGANADSHERAHAEDIRRRFSTQRVTTIQIVMFGLTGGLIPCPASITILLLCLQLKQFTLGATLVLCFSVGLALTMVAVGAAAAMSVHHVSTRWAGFNAIARIAPYVSGALIICLGLYSAHLGWQGLMAAHT